jgi:putative ABC transport system ATP-binding protein
LDIGIRNDAAEDKKGSKMENELVIKTVDLQKIYQMGDIEVQALRGVSIEIKTGEVVSIMGPSGSGKSTMMNTLGCLDRPTSGEYFLDNERVSDLNDDQLAVIRNRKIGFIFQSFMLLGRETALANVGLPLRYSGEQTGVTDRAREALESVGLGDRIHHKPTELSGGQQQRVAIARSLINNPSILMADEPTGNLDSKSGKEIMEIILRLNKERGTTVVVVTHDPRIAEQTNRVITLKDGLLESDQ